MSVFNGLKVSVFFQILTGKLTQVGSNMPSSPDSSSDSSTGSPHHGYEGPNKEAEQQLPGVVCRSWWTLKDR